VAFQVRACCNDADAGETAAVPRDLREPATWAELRDPTRVPGVHLRLPEDRAARLCDGLLPLRPGPAVRGTQIPQALPLVVPRRGGVPRRGREPDPRRLRRGGGAEVDRGDRRLPGPRGDPHRRANDAWRAAVRGDLGMA